MQTIQGKPALQYRWSTILDAERMPTDLSALPSTWFARGRTGVSTKLSGSLLLLQRHCPSLYHETCRLCDPSGLRCLWLTHDLLLPAQVAQLPGSEFVLERSVGRLVACTRLLCSRGAGGTPEEVVRATDNKTGETSPWMEHTATSPLHSRLLVCMPFLLSLPQSLSTVRLTRLWLATRAVSTLGRPRPCSRQQPGSLLILSQSRRSCSWGCPWMVSAGECHCSHLPRHWNLAFGLQAFVAHSSEQDPS